jgi:predicted transglutaminase-like cysteine proteinase
MVPMKIRWRSATIAKLALAVAVIAPPCAAARTDGGRSEVGRLGRFTITKTDAPPDVLARGRAASQATLMTQVVLERSGIKEVRAYRDFLRRSARLDRAAQLAAVNDYVTLNVRVTADANLYQGNDVWAPPINTLTVGGDCEDIALVKSWGLKYMGFPAKDLFLVVGVTSNVTPPEGHAVLVARLRDGRFYVLDNTDRRILRLEDATRFEPAYAINGFGYWEVDDPNRSYGDFWRHAFRMSAERHAR